MVKMKSFVNVMWLVLAAVIGVLPCLAFAADAGVTLQGEGLSVRFGGAADGYGIRGFENRMAGGTHFSVSDGRKADFWRLVFTADGGCDMTKAVQLDNLAPCRDRRIERMPGGLAFHWQGLTVPGGEEGAVDVRADVKLTNGDETEWRLYVTNRDKKWTLFETHYPYVRQIVPDGVADVLTPGRNMGGRLVRKYNSRKEWRNRWGYPGLYPMVTAFMLGDAGLYVAAHDGEARIKTLSLAAGCDLSFQTVVENAGVSGKAAEGPRYPVVIAAFRGDWWQAARRYRDWALKQRWCAKGRIVNRTDWPKAMTDIDIWLLSNQCSATNLRKRMAKVKAFYPDMKICVHWYGWNAETPGLGECPYFSPGSDVRETVDFMNSKDILLMPYVDGRLQSKASARFEVAQAEACRTAAGGLNEETWGKASYVVMCPTMPQFGRAVLDTATNIVLGCGFGAVYEDQVACSRAVPCFDPAHGHPLGGGTWWADGYRTILTSMHDTLAAKNRPITSEGACEVWLDLIDGYLQAETPKGDDIPFYSVVYGGHAVYFGARMKYEDPEAFFALQARAPVWGIAPNWQRISDDFVEGRLPGAIEILRRVARIRKAAAAFLKYGSLEDELRLLGDAGTRRVDWLGADGDQWGKRFSADMPDVFGTVWSDVSGTRSAVCAVNICDTPRTIRFKSIFSTHPQLLAVEGENKAEMNEDGDILSLELPPLGIAVLTGPSAVTK